MIEGFPSVGRLGSAWGWYEGFSHDQVVADVVVVVGVGVVVGTGLEAAVPVGGPARLFAVFAIDLMPK